jgi:hypothetical protein
VVEMPMTHPHREYSTRDFIVGLGSKFFHQRVLYLWTVEPLSKQTTPGEKTLQEIPTLLILFFV